MSNLTNIVGIEILVRRIDDVLPVLVDALGWEVAYRGPSGEVNGETVVLDAGSITVTLLEPAESGPKLLSDREPRLTQLVMGGAPEDIVDVERRLTGLGVPTHSGGPGRRFVPPEAAAGLFGFQTALVLQAIEDADETNVGDAGVQGGG